MGFEHATSRSSESRGLTTESPHPTPLHPTPPHTTPHHPTSPHPPHPTPPFRGTPLYVFMAYQMSVIKSEVCKGAVILQNLGRVKIYSGKTHHTFRPNKPMVIITDWAQLSLCLYYWLLHCLWIYFIEVKCIKLLFYLAQWIAELYTLVS